MTLYETYTSQVQTFARMGKRRDTDRITNYELRKASLVHSPFLIQHPSSLRVMSFYPVANQVVSELVDFLDAIALVMVCAEAKNA